MNCIIWLTFQAEHIIIDKTSYLCEVNTLHRRFAGETSEWLVRKTEIDFFFYNNQLPILYYFFLIISAFLQTPQLFPSLFNHITFFPLQHRLITLCLCFSIFSFLQYHLLPPCFSLFLLSIPHSSVLYNKSFTTYATHPDKCTALHV